MRLPDLFIYGEGPMTGWRVLAAAAALLAGTTLGADAEVDSKEEEISPWEFDLTVKEAGGYKNNVLLSDFNKESSAFNQTSLEFFAYHLPLNHWEFSGFAMYEDRRYWESESIDREVIGMASGDLKRVIGERWKVGANLQYFYNDQVYDASILEGIPARVRAKGHQLMGGPAVRLDLPGNRRVELNGVIARQEFAAPLDDYWEVGPKLVLGQKFSKFTDLAVTLRWRDRAYDERAAPGRAGKSLHFDQKESEASLKHYWDEEKVWNTRTRVGLEYNEDNGNGFFDYWRLKFSQEAGFTKGGFLGSLQAKALHYDYLNQRGLDGNGRARTELTFTARAEQQIIKRLKIFAEYEHEWIVAEDRTDRYRTTTFMAGLEWEIK
jgi:hypothetical protein